MTTDEKETGEEYIYTDSSLNQGSPDCVHQFTISGKPTSATFRGYIEIRTIQSCCKCGKQRIQQEIDRRNY